MLGLNKQETKRLMNLQREYNARKSQMIEIVEAMGGTMDREKFEGTYAAEFGCMTDFRFLDSSQVTMCDSDGKQIFCKCGKPASAGIIGAEAHIAQCAECFNAISNEGEYGK